MAYFVNTLLVMCGISCGIPLLFIAQRLSSRYLPSDTQRDRFNESTVDLMAERNRLDTQKVQALWELVALATKK